MKVIVKVFYEGNCDPIRTQEFPADKFLNWVEVWGIPDYHELLIRVELEEMEE